LVSLADAFNKRSYKTNCFAILPKYCGFRDVRHTMCL
ncbi:HAMP domain protein, partial [Chlamydia psittaci 84-8471/1]